MGTLHFLALLIVAVVCALGVLHPRYHDNLIQRAGMAVTCLACTADVYALSMGGDSTNAHQLMTSGVALFALGTVIKKWHGERFQRRRESDHHRAA